MAIRTTLELEASRQNDIIAARTDFLEFVLECFGPAYVLNWHHVLIADRLTRLYHEKGKRLMIFVPPQYGKSQLVSRMYPAWVLGQDPMAKIIMSSYSADLANSFNLNAQSVMASEVYGKIFPETLIKGNTIDQNAAKGLVRTRNEVHTTEGGYLFSTGVGGATTGRTSRPLFIVDDPVKDLKQAYSEAYRKTLIDWYNGVAETRLHKDANVIVMNTRWHEQDLAGQLLEHSKTNPEGKQWEVISLPAVACDPMHPQDPRAVGEALWPDFKGDEEFLGHLKHSVGSKVWFALFQQQPVIEGGNSIKDYWFKYFNEYPDEREFDEQCIVVDAAFKDLDTSDYVVIQVWGRIDTRKLLLDQTRGHFNVTETAEKIKEAYAKWPQAWAKLIEDKANGPAVIQLLKHELSGLIEQPAEGSKESRVNAAIPQIEAGNVELPHPNICPFDLALFLKECRAFPEGENDDQVDALAYGILRLSRHEKSFINKIINKKSVDTYENFLRGFTL